MERVELEKKTRKIFHALHTEQGDEKYIFDRLSTLLSPEFLKVDADYFKGKVCLDAGCGSNANATWNMLSMGAEKVYAFDLDETVIHSVPKYLKKFEGKYEVCIGNVLNINFPDNYFNFVHCAGVLHHSADVYKGLSELMRVTESGGILYFDVYGKGGLVRDMTTFFRTKYSNDKEFRDLIDNLNEEALSEFFQWIITVMSEKDDALAKKAPMSLIKELFDKDLVLTIKDRIQAPVYYENTEEELVLWLKENGFEKIERITKYPHYKNVRRFLSPLYEQYDNKFSRIFYGSGQVQLKAVKS